MTMLFINLPAADLAASRAFYTALGYSVNEYSSDDATLSVVLDDNIVLALHTTGRFADQFDLVGAEPRDPAGGTTVVHALSTASREDADALLARATTAGASDWGRARDTGGTYVRGFTDPDGHAWQVTYLEPRHVID